MCRLAKKNPIVFLENCLRHHGREVKGYRALLAKHERLEGKLADPELVRVSFRERPHSVLLQWLQGERLAGTVLYVEGENHEKALVRPAGWRRIVGIVERDPVGPEARQNGRYTLPDFGIRIGMERTLASWVAAAKRGHLHISYLGMKPIPELNNRNCYILRRTGYDKPEDEGITDLTLYFDAENFLQIGSVLRDARGDLIGEYFFRDLELNPSFPPQFFTRKAMP